MTGLAKEATVTVGWRPGDRSPAVLQCVGASLDAARRCASLLPTTLDYSGGQWGRTNALPTIARWGHFTESHQAWELQRIN